MAVVDRSTKGEKTLHGINLFVLALLTVIFFYLSYKSDRLDYSGALLSHLSGL